MWRPQSLAMDPLPLTMGHKDLIGIPEPKNIMILLVTGIFGRVSQRFTSL